MQVTRRAGLAAMLAATGLLTRVPQSEAAFGEAANIFGKTTSTAGASRPRRAIHHCEGNLVCNAQHEGPANGSTVFFAHMQFDV